LLFEVFSDKQTMMKRESKHPGGHAKASEQTITKHRQSVGKIFNQEEWLREVERERGEQRRKHRELLEQWGVSDEDLTEWWKQNELDGRDAAYEDAADEELCCDLAGKFARESASRTEAKEIGSIRDNYEAIVLGFIGVRSLSVVLRNETDQAPADFLRKLGNWVADYVSCCVQGKEDRYNWTLSGHTVSKELLTALALEYDRDRDGLMQFLSAVFARLREIDQPNSLRRVRLLTHQFAGTPKEIANALERIGAVSKCTTSEQFESLHARVKQYCSRDRTKALEKRQKPR
jgi:hypothetical protein